MCSDHLNRSGNARTEWPSSAEGVIDLAFREVTPEGAVWTVVDFKTDAELDGRRSKYETQVSIYVEAVRSATGERARGVLLSV